MINKKTILFASLILIIIIFGSGATYYYLNFERTNTPAYKQIADSDNPEISDLINIDLSDSSLPSSNLPEVNMDLGFESATSLEDGSDKKLNIPEVDLSAPAVPEIADFKFDSNDLEDSFIQSSTTQNSNTQSDTKTQATQAEADAKTEADAPGDTEATAPPTQTGPSASDCAQFNSAPSCDYVPANVRDICLQCKN